MPDHFQFSSLSTADLIVDAVYEGGGKGNTADDPLKDLVPGCGNQGGFRAVGGWTNPRVAVLYSSMDDPDWPDFLDIYGGTFTYFGDNKRAGKDLHDTPRKGNLLLRQSFDQAHGGVEDRRKVPPFLVFTKGLKGRDVVFRGLCVPGAEGHVWEDLVAVWRSRDGKRFQNYKSLFTVLDVPCVSRAWLADAISGHPFTPNAPKTWLRWINEGTYDPLVTKPTLQHRSKAQQMPGSEMQRNVVETIYKYFKDDPYGFEQCAVEIAKLMDRNIQEIETTRRSRDGGRDAIGIYRVGPKSDPIGLDFALEAKCYALNSGVGVEDLSRLISRLRHRQFGILVTTSYLAEQAYQEVRADTHPVIVIAAADIAQILSDAGHTTNLEVDHWLRAVFPRMN